MQFSKLILSASAFAVASAQVEFTNSAFDGITVGEPFNITWADGVAPYTLILKDGSISDLQTVATIASGIEASYFEWTPSSTLASGTYALEIEDSESTNYSLEFTLTGGSSSASSSASQSTTSSSSSAATTTTSQTTSTSSSSSSSSTSSTSTKSSSSSKTTSASTSASSSASKTTSATTSATSIAALSSASNNLASPLAMVVLALAAIIFPQ